MVRCMSDSGYKRLYKHLMEWRRLVYDIFFRNKTLEKINYQSVNETTLLCFECEICGLLNECFQLQDGLRRYTRGAYEY